MKLTTSKANPSIGVLLTAEYVREEVDVSVEAGQANNLVVSSDVTFNAPASICRYLVRAAPAKALYGANDLERSEIDHWLEFSYGRLSCTSEFDDALLFLDHVLGPVTFLVNHCVTLADIAVWGTLRGSPTWHQLVVSGEAPKNVVRYYSFLAAQEKFSAVEKTLPQVKVQPKQPVQKERKEEGKFIDLPGAKIGEVVVRFPPEASGYLHVGHAKAALLNQYYQLTFEGKLVMRFDDTNPAKESSEFEQVILEDLKMLGVKPDIFTHTSDSFDLIMGFCEKLMAEGKVYCDDTAPEQMKLEREERAESACRSNTVERNFEMWEEMKAGTAAGKTYCVRAKIDMKSDNGCMRDPTVYRCKDEPHVRTGTKYKVYPTYDFACPIVDSVEGVTHALRTTEYHDRDVQFYWFIEQMGLRKPYIWEYSRLNLQNTIMSKRKLTWFVNEGIVDGWDDPRFPTVRGVLRHGMTVEGLKQFVIAQGSSRSVVMMDWEKIWAFNKKVIDPISPRYTALVQHDVIRVIISGVSEEKKQVQKHPKDPALGMKDVWYGPSVMIEAADAADFTEGQNVTFINWGNLIIKKINRSDGKVTSIEAEQNLSNTDYKKTHKVTWLTVTDSAPLVPTACVHYDNIITKAVLAKEDNFKDYVNRDTKTVTEMLGDPMLATLKKGDIIQLQRKGFFICDSAFEEISGRHSPVVLFAIPDGHVKDVHQAGSKHKGAQQEKADVPSAKEKAQSKKGKAAEKSPQDEKPPSLPVANNDATAIDTKITAQGVKVRELKAAKAPKDEVQAAVKVLLDLKAEYKKATGQDWKPSTIPAPAISLTATSPVGDSDAAGLDAKISAQGSKVREIKAAKAPKDEVQAAVKVLLDLKAEYKKVTGQDWKPGTNPAPAVAPAAAPAEEASDAAGLDVKIATQGNKVREIKAAKASKEEVQAAVKVLLDLKAKYKKMVGKDWKPSATHAPDAAPVAASVVRDSDAAGLDAKISAQGNTVREIKAAKAPKDEVQVAVKILLDLKAEYKKMTGHDWKPSTTPVPATALTAAVATDLDAACLDAKISAQGSKVREIKATKAPKDEVQAAVKVLLDLKAEYKNATGLDWKPSTTPAPTAARAAAPATLACGDAAGLGDRVTAQGNKVRELKSSKAPKDEVQAAVKELLDLKAEYKKVTGQDWKPGAAPAPAEASAPVVEAVASGDLSEADELQEKIDAQGGTVRDLKGKKAPKEEIDAAVKALLGLKAEYKTLAGEDPAPSAGGGGRQKKDKKEKANKENQPKKEQKEQPQSKPKKEQPQTKDCGDGAAREVKKMTRLGLEAKKEENLPDWYSQVITKSEMIEYYDVSGCYVLRPWSFSIWERIQAWFDAKIKEMGFQNVYFPIFVSNAALQKEKEHIEDFAPEVAWVTRSGESELAEPIAIRPTSETVMYPAYARWIQSHRDLPIKLNQWCNVVRWEFKHPQPFLRTREFLWQEGHSAYATYKEAEEEVYAILGLYEEIYEQHMAIPVVKGRKTQKEKFAGGDFTTTVEVFISATGRGIQAATSHHLGQNFSKMFDLSFEDPASGDRHFAYQNSWAITTRSIGIIVMVHGDNKGLVLPPRMACIQIIVVPCGITTNLSEEDRKAVEAKCEEVVRTLKAAGVRTQGDYRDNYSPGWKFNHWELKGVPVRVELGPRDMKQGTLVAVRRDTGEKTTLKSEDATTALLDMLNTMHDDMFAKVKKERDEHMTQVESMNDFCTALDKKCMVLAPFCGEIPCEEQIKVVSARDAVVEEGAPAMGAKGLCIPFVQPAEITPEMKCICPDCPNPPKNYTLFGRSY